MTDQAHAPKPVVFLVDASIDITGAFIAVRREARLLRESADFVLVLPRESRVPDSLLGDFADVLKLPMPQIRKHLPSLILYFPALLFTSTRLRLSMRRHGCDRVQLNDFYLMHGTVLRLLGFRGRIATWVRIDPRRFGRIGKAWLALVRRSSTRLVAVSRFIQSCLGDGVDTDLAYEWREPERLGPARTEGDRRLLYVGNYIAGKGQDAALAAFQMVATSFPDARLCFVGGDMGRKSNRSYREDLERRAAQGPAAGRVEFLGRMDDVSPLYRKSYAALNFSQSESFSMTCQDASAFGLPIIATRCGGPEEIIEEGETGYLVPVGDVGAMAARIGDVLEDRSLARAMGARGAKLVMNRFGAARIRPQLEQILDLRSGPD